MGGKFPHHTSHKNWGALPLFSLPDFSQLGSREPPHVYSKTALIWAWGFYMLSINMMKSKEYEKQEPMCHQHTAATINVFQVSLQITID